MTAPDPIASLKPSDLPEPPQAALQIVRACTRDDISSQELTKLVNADAVLAAELLRLANSAYFGYARQVDSIARAIAVIGQRALRNLALCLAMRDAVRPEQIPGLDMAAYWEDNLRRAVVARLLGQTAGLDSETCFTAGLLQDFGLLVLFFLYPQHAAHWGRLRALDPVLRYDLERRWFGITHDQAGLLLARTWGLPDTLCAALGYHHRAEDIHLDARHVRLCQVLYCADWMASVYTAEDKAGVLAACRAAVHDKLALNDAQADRLLAAVGEQVEEAAAALGLQVPPQEDFDAILRAANLHLAAANQHFQELTWRLEKTLQERDQLAAELRRELELAREIQRSLLPTQRGEGCPIAGVNFPAHELSGDFYDYFALPDGRIYFNLGDVAGKGVNAALLMAKTSSLFRCLGKQVHDPAQLLAQINQEICETSVRGMFVTLVAGLYDPQCGSAIMANAGHPPGLLLNRLGEVSTVPAGAPPLGVTPDAVFPTQAVPLAGGSLWLFSDGISDARLDTGRTLGIDGLAQRIQTLAQHRPCQQLSGLLQGIQSALSDGARDDMTALVLQDVNGDGNRLFFRRCPAQAEQLKPLRHGVRQALQKIPCTAECIDRLVLAVNEACMNVIQHAYCCNAATPPATKKTKTDEIVVEILDNQGTIVCLITDFGKPADPGCLVPRDVRKLRPGGLGVHLIQQVMDEVRFLAAPAGVGNVLKMSKRLSPPKKP